MPQFYIKINQYDGFVRKYKLVGPTEWKIDITPDLEDAGLFDKDDYIIKLVKYYFPGNVELFPTNDVNEVFNAGTFSQSTENIPTTDFYEEWM